MIVMREYSFSAQVAVTHGREDANNTVTDSTLYLAIFRTKKAFSQGKVH